MCPNCGYIEGETATEPYFLSPGMILHDRYIVGEVKGFGGFGITYRAYDKNLDTVVAVKEYYYSGIATRSPGSQEVQIYTQSRTAEYNHFLSRFLDEAKYTAKFSKNNSIVNVFDYFQENNTAYMVMEFLDGITLSEALKAGKMTIENGVAAMQEICLAMKAIHAEGIIHRDISPDNIMMCSDGKVKIFDFGAARFSRHEDREQVKLTQVMKPGFSPPEQYQTISKQGSWTDIYAMGATLYYILTGHKPIESTNRKVEDTLPAPQELNPNIPDYLNDTILRSMAIDIHLRFANVNEFLKALNAERKVYNIEKERKRRKRYRWTSAITAVIIVAVAFGVFFYGYNVQRIEETLPDSTINFWYSLPDDPVLSITKTSSYEAIIVFFNESYPNVIINLTAYSENGYLSVLADAAANNTLPQLFESTGADEQILEHSQSVGSLVRDISNAQAMFFSQYRSRFPDEKKFPLGFTLPIIYENIAPDYALEVTGSDRDLFLAGETSFFEGTSSDYIDVQRAIPGRYKMTLVTSDGSDFSFTDTLSIGITDNNQLRVVNTLLMYMLSENAQDYLHIQHQSRSLPVSRSALYNEETGFISVYDSFADILNSIR